MMDRGFLKIRSGLDQGFTTSRLSISSDYDFQQDYCSDDPLPIRLSNLYVRFKRHILRAREKHQREVLRHMTDTVRIDVSDRPSGLFKSWQERQIAVSFMATVPIQGRVASLYPYLPRLLLPDTVNPRDEWTVHLALNVYGHLDTVEGTMVVHDNGSVIQSIECPDQNTTLIERLKEFVGTPVVEGYSLKIG